MGRYITCEAAGKRETVWKYLFGSQPSEAYRIYEELGIGEYHPFCDDYEDNEEDEIQPRYKYLPTRQGADGDVLILNREDLEKLSSCLETLKADGSQAARYIWMIAAIRDFMLKHPHQENATDRSAAILWLSTRANPVALSLLWGFWNDRLNLGTLRP